MAPEAGTANDTGEGRNRSTATKGGAAATLRKHQKPGGGCPEVRFEPVVEPELPDADHRYRVPGDRIAAGTYLLMGARRGGT